MDIILIAGLWLDGPSWDSVAEPLRWAGHEVHAITLPGMESVDSDRTGITLADHVAAVVAVIDSIPASRRVMVVGHSAGCAVAWAAVDARPHRVARAVVIGGFPTADGDAIASGFGGEGADVPLPDWSMFDEADLRGLDEAWRERFRQLAIPSPAGVTGASQHLHDERRYRIPVTAVCPEYTPEMLHGWIDDGLAPVAEFTRIEDVTVIGLPTGHWPQFTRAYDLARLLDTCTRLAPGDPAMIDEYGRVDPPAAGAETAVLLGFLEFQRTTFDWRCIGPDAAGLRATVGASDITLGGLLKHMALVEDSWFSHTLHGHDRGEPWASVDWDTDPDWEWHSAADDTPGELATMWHAAVGRSRRLAAETVAADGLDTLAARSKEWGTPNLRWIVTHMIEEYARHNGHADLIRETIDGVTGE